VLRVLYKMKILKKNFKVTQFQIIVLLVLVIIIFVSRFVIQEKISSDLSFFIINISSAIIASILVGIYYDNSIRRELSDEILSKVKLRDEVVRSGIVSYYSSFTDIPLRNYFESSKNVEIYVHYAQTLFNQIGDILEKFVQVKKNELNIFLLHEDNKFLVGLGAHWGFNDIESDENHLKNKINASTQLLLKTFKDLQSKNKLKAKIRIYKLKRHPVFYSFYFFDDYIIFVPSKLVQNKNFKPLAFIAKKGNSDGDIYDKCFAEINDIKSTVDAIEEVFKAN